MNHPVDHPAPIARISSSIPGLDTILGGGFLRNGVYIVQGQPGCGKTILANQMCYGHVARGGTAVYVTLLTESHARMLQHLSILSFFRVDALPDRLGYVSGFHELEKGGLKGLATMLGREMRSRRAGVLVLDGLVAASEAAPEEVDLKKFIQELQSIAALSDCTVLLLTSGRMQHAQAEHTMVDGLIDLQDELFAVRSERSIQVLKFRGAGPLRGKHAFRIDDDGIRVYPRTESIYTSPSLAVLAAGVAGSGIPSLDALLHARGIPRGSSTVVVGSTGTGKTTVGLHFIQACSNDEPGLHVGFFEGPERLRLKAGAFGLALEPLERSGALELMWRSPGEHLLDELADQVLANVARRGVRRLVIDGLSGFTESATHPERISRFFSSFTNELRNHGVTAVMTLETRDVLSSVVSMPFGLSALVDNLFFLRFVHDAGEVERLLTIIKMRDTDYAAGLHRARIDGNGMHLAGRLSAGGDVIPSAEPLDTPAGGGGQ
jgi:circadian clock protein KaiC